MAKSDQTQTPNVTTDNPEDRWEQERKLVNFCGDVRTTASDVGLDAACKRHGLDRKRYQSSLHAPVAAIAYGRGPNGIPEEIVEAAQRVIAIPVAILRNQRIRKNISGLDNVDGQALKY